MTKKPKDDQIRVRNTPVFKLKDKEGRRFQGIHLVKQFGFVPETIIIEKKPGANNEFFVRALLTKEEIKKEKKKEKEAGRIVNPEAAFETREAKKVKGGKNGRHNKGTEPHN